MVASDLEARDQETTTASIRPGSFSEEEARALTDEVKVDAAALWTKLLRLYEGGAHTALGYSSWGDYYEAEFNGSKSGGYRLLDAARVVGALTHSPIGEWVAPTESIARELVPVLRQSPEAVPVVYYEAVEKHGPEPTAVQVREVVTERFPDRHAARVEALEEMRADEAYSRLYQALYGVAKLGTLPDDLARFDRDAPRLTPERRQRFEEIAASAAAVIDHARSLVATTGLRRVK